MGILAWAAVAQAASPPHLDEMPPVERVLEIQGLDRLETAARQVETLEHLARMTARLSDGRAARGKLTADERRLVETYRVAAASAEASILATLGVEGSHRKQAEETWARWRARYANDDGFREAILRRFFSPGWQASYRAVEARDRQGLAASSVSRAWVVGSILTAVACAAAVVALLVVRRGPKPRIEEPPFLDVLEAAAREAREIRSPITTAGAKGSRR